MTDRTAGPVAAPIRRLRLRGGDVELRLIGAAPGHDADRPLVFLHEGLGSLGLWRDFPDEVAARTGRAALVWSRHGYGRSDGVAGPRHVGYMHAEALEVLPELLDRLELRAPILIGHSDGASIALIHAGGTGGEGGAGAAVTAGGAVGVGAAGGSGGAGAAVTAGGAVTGIVALAPHVVVEAHTLGGIRAAREQYLHTDLRARLGRHHADPDATFWGWNDIWLAPAFEAWNIEEYLPAIRCPVLLVQCADDPYGTTGQLDRVARQVPAPVERVVLDAGGHAPQRSHPAEVADAIAAFAQDLP